MKPRVALNDLTAYTTTAVHSDLRWMLTGLSRGISNMMLIMLLQPLCYGHYVMNHVHHDAVERKDITYLGLKINMNFESNVYP